MTTPATEPSVAPVLRAWAALDDQIRTQRTALDALYRQRAALEDQVATWMRKEGQTAQMDVRYGAAETLRCRLRPEPAGLTWTYLREQCAAYFADSPAIARGLLTHLQRQRPTTTVMDIQRHSSVSQLRQRPRSQSQSKPAHSQHPRDRRLPSGDR